MVVWWLWSAVLIAELLAVVASKTPGPNLLLRGATSKTLPKKELNFLPFDETYTAKVNKSTTPYYILVHQQKEQSLFMTVTPCNSRLNWDLKFVPLTDNQPMIIWDEQKTNKYGKLLVEYTGVSISIPYNHVRAYQGLYVISVQSVDEESLVMFYVTLRPKSPKNKLTVRPSGIKIKKGGQKISLRWNLSHIDHHLMKYCLVVSTKKMYATLCEAESRLKEKGKWSLTSNNSDDDIPLDNSIEIYPLGFNTNCTLADLVYDKTYYFTVFALNGSHMAMQHANATYKFQRPKPISLKDAKPTTINLRAQSGKASFRYKVGNKSFEDGGSPNTLYWYVMPCGGVVTVEIRNRKTLLIKKRIFGYEKIVLNNTKYGERYVLKVETVSVDETQHVKSIEVMATVRPALFPMPDMPNDLSIRQYVSPNDCQSVTIGWLSAKYQKDLRYCVYVQEYKPSNSVDFSVRPDQCEVSNGIIRRRDVDTSREKFRCYNNEKEKVTVEKILNLRSSLTYIIQVTVKKPKGRTLSYDLLKLDTNSCGLN